MDGQPFAEVRRRKTQSPRACVLGANAEIVKPTDADIVKCSDLDGMRVYGIDGYLRIHEHIVSLRSLLSVASRVAVRGGARIDVEREAIRNPDQIFTSRIGREAAGNGIQGIQCDSYLLPGREIPALLLTIAHRLLQLHRHPSN